MIAPVSNGNISLMVALARRNGLPWDAILGSEIAGDFKPKPRVYLAACEALDLPVEACMMVAAHAERSCAPRRRADWQTAFISRPIEHGATRPRRVAAIPDNGGLYRSDVLNLAEQLGA